MSRSCDGSGSVEGNRQQTYCQGHLVAMLPSFQDCISQPLLQLAVAISGRGKLL